MIAVVLAAGYGTRLYPLTESTPKALLPLQESSILGHLERKLANPRLGVREALLVSNHRFYEPFRRWAGSLKSPLRWAVLDDGSTSDDNRLGSIGDLLFAIRKRSLEDDLLVLGSDNLFEDDLVGFVDYALRKGAVTLGAYELPDRSLATQYGVLTAGADGRITAFAEKPARPASSLISTAVYFFPRKAVGGVLEYVSSGQSSDKLGSFISWWVAREPVYAYRFRGLWFDIGDIASYRHAQESFHP